MTSEAKVPRAEVPNSATIPVATFLFKSLDEGNRNKEGRKALRGTALNWIILQSHHRPEHNGIKKV